VNGIAERRQEDYIEENVVSVCPFSIVEYVTLCNIYFITAL
jgi:hypothetical protein